MKKFGKKLVLSGLALAATAATLSTSTYAWYVNNPSSNVTGATAATSSAGSDGSILVSNTGEATEFFKNISLTPAASTYKLEPITTTDGKAFKTQGGDDAAATQFIKYTFYVKADAAGTFKLVCAASNETATFLSQTAMDNTGDTGAETGLPTNVDAGQAFTKNAADAMYMSITITPDGGSASTTIVPLTDGGFTWATDSNKPTGDFAAGGNAHDYYAQILSTTAPTENELTTATIGDSGTSFNVGTAKSKVEIVFWLEGGDIDCFNSCAGQNFTFDFTLKYTKSNA